MGGLFLKADPLTFEEAVKTALADFDPMVSQTLAKLIKGQVWSISD